MIKSTQMDYFPSQSSNLNFDYNCNTVIEREYTGAAVNCGLVQLNCNSVQGYLGTVPACGLPGQWGTCQIGDLGIGCKNDVRETGRVMRCK